MKFPRCPLMIFPFFLCGRQQLIYHWFMCSVWVARRPPGYAFIDFDDKRDAEDAIRELDGMHRRPFRSPEFGFLFYRLVL